MGFISPLPDICSAASLGMEDRTVLFIPPNDANPVQAAQITPDMVIQTPGILQYAGQQLSNQPPLNHEVGLREKLQKAESKTLGAIQIIIGLVHIGFGSVSVADHRQQYVGLATLAGYPFWGGLFFIASGSLSVSAEKYQTILLVKRSVGMNITSAGMALIGMALYISGFIAKSSYYYYYSYDSASQWSVGLEVLLFMFSSLEFCITVWTAHFWCQTTTFNSDMDMMVVPDTVGTGGAVPAEAILSPPPPYDFVASAQKWEDSPRSQERP
ncbi:membrane-spanning 4-domains subfamily A member 15-like [Paroedura picta]|uniref:membrane-spanning 4-domains subfamily A member 15-like n=1 Tax=Paroedura picta TaxID=143630 RepID=UPI0040570383